MTGAPGLMASFSSKTAGKTSYSTLISLSACFGNFHRVGGDGGHAIAHVAHFVVEADLIVGRRIGVALSAGGVFDALDVFVMDDGVHAGQRDGFAVVDVQDAGVGVGAGEQLGVQHAAHVDVIDEGGVAFGQFDGVDFGFWFADNGRFRDARC